MISDTVCKSVCKWIGKFSGELPTDESLDALKKRVPGGHLAGHNEPSGFILTTILGIVGSIRHKLFGAGSRLV